VPSVESREAWETLRESPEAAYVCLALPRYLARQPYGKSTDPIESFAFEEMPAPPPHEAFLWGSASILCGHVLAAAFQAEGWEMQTGGYGEVGELPVFSFTEEGETVVKPCAEAWLASRAAQKLTDAGLTAIQSIRGQDAVRIETVRSLTGASLHFG
jgi:type VI secretion system protein ImpC